VIRDKINLFPLDRSTRRSRNQAESNGYNYPFVCS
jgi:hypothetical protein